MTVTIEMSIELFKKFYNRKHIWRTKKKEKMVLKNVTLIRRQAKFKRIVRNNWQFQFWKRRKNNKVLGRRKKQKLWIYRQRFREEATRIREHVKRENWVKKKKRIETVRGNRSKWQVSFGGSNFFSSFP